MTDPGLAPQSVEPKGEEDYYNRVFERLEAGNSKLVSSVAYAFYKIAKREWIEDFKVSHGRRPLPDECKLHTATQTDSALEGYMSRAQQVLADYAQDVIKDEKPKILAEALKGDFSRSFWPSFWASVAFAGLLTALVLIAAALGAPFPIQWNISPDHPTERLPG